MNHFLFRQMKKEEIPVYTDEIFAVLADNMREIEPTGNTYDEDYKSFLEYAVPVWREGGNKVILIFDGDVFCGYFQYSVSDATFRMESIVFKKDYHGSGLFTELYRYLMTIIPADTKYVDAFSGKNNIKSQEILKHLGLINIGENKNGKAFHFKGDYKTLQEHYSE